MQWNKNTGSIMLAVGVLIGGAAAVGLSARAQDGATSPSSPAIVSAAVQTATPNVSSPMDKNDTDTIQDLGGKEQPDIVAPATGKQDVETNDDQAEVNDKGTHDGQEATEKGDQFNAAQKQTKMDAHKQELAQEVVSGKITQAQMDQQLQTMVVHESKEKNDTNDPKDAGEGMEKNESNDTNEQGE